MEKKPLVKVDRAPVANPKALSFLDTDAVYKNLSREFPRHGATVANPDRSF
jgi:hypothetical protein